jgi:predicted nucleic acid-binding protein
MKPRGNPAVRDWLDAQSAESLFITSVSVSKLLVGVSLLPPGKRRTLLSNGLDALLQTLFGTRILPFDHQAARAHATLLSRARSKGHAVSLGDVQIAAIAQVHGFAVATRDTAPFAAMGIPVINPFPGR